MFQLFSEKKNTRLIIILVWFTFNDTFPHKPNPRCLSFLKKESFWKQWFPTDSENYVFKTVLVIAVETGNGGPRKDGKVRSKLIFFLPASCYMYLVYEFSCKHNEFSKWIDSTCLFLKYQIDVNLVNIDHKITRNPPTWRQEAYRPPRIKYSTCCPISGGGGGARHPCLGENPILGTPLSWPDWGVPHPWPGGYPILGTPILTWSGVVPGKGTETSHWGTSQKGHGTSECMGWR